MTRHMTNNAVTSHHVRLVAIYKENDMDYYLEVTDRVRRAPRPETRLQYADRL